MKALDIVIIPSGAMAIISETNNNGQTASIEYLNEKDKKNRHNAWWNKEDLIIINSLSRLLASMTYHPFGLGEEDVNIFFPKEENNE